MIRHHLTPHFIVQQHSLGQTHGRFPAVALFMDASGFTAAMEVLMKEGQHGAEIMANIMTAIFSPLVDQVYAYGGFVAGFAGDAFTAIFPLEEAEEGVICRRVLTAGVNIQQHMQQHPTYQTPYGTFSFSVKLGVAAGEVAWGILAGEDPHQHSYYFSGPAVDECAAAEHHASGGDLIASRPVWLAVQQWAQMTETDTPEYVKIGQTAALEPEKPLQLPSLTLPQAQAFASEELLTQLLVGEFRQTINMFINLDGVQNHEQLAEFMRHVFRLQKIFGGYFCRVDFGDKGCNLLIFWGAPVAYENDVERALNFVLELQTAVALPLRVGLTYYISHAGYIGAPIREEYTCYSRGTNLAARQMMKAPWGEIWCDKALADRGQQSFQVEFVGELPFKGFAEPQPVYRLTGRRTADAHKVFQNPLIGRESELQQLLQALSPLGQQKFAGVVEVYGEAGMGKSRLVYEFAQQAKNSALAPLWIYAPADEIIRQSLNPFRYWLRFYFTQESKHSEAENKQKFEQKLAQLIQQINEPELQQAVERTHSFLGALLELYWPNSLYEQLEPQLRFANSLEALKTLLKAECSQRPVVLELDDAQWLDSDSQQFCRQLTHNIEQIPLLIVVNSREKLAENLFDPAVPHQTINLNTLNKAGVAQFVQTVLNRPVTPELIEFLFQRTDGNPFYLEQVLLYLQEKQLLDLENLAENVALPTDVRAVLVARLDRLAQEVRQVVQTAAVLGREFETRLLSQMLLGETEMAQKLLLAEHAAVWNALNEIKYIFKHGLLRDAAYDMQLRSRLQILHRLAATALEVIYADELNLHLAEIAYHYDQAQDVGMAAGYYKKAADHARSHYHNDEALTHYGRALDITPPEEIELVYDLLLGREAVLDWQGKRDAQQADLAQLQKLAEQMGEAWRQAEVALRWANYWLVTSRYAEGQEQAQQAIKQAQTAGDVLLEAKAQLTAGKIFTRQSAYDQAKIALQNCLTLSSQTLDQQIQADSLMSLGQIFWYQGEYEPALEHLQKSLKFNQQLKNQRGEAGCLNAIGAIYGDLGDSLTAQSYSKKVLEICQTIGYRRGETIILRNLGGELTDLGDYEPARFYIQKSLLNCRELNDKWGEAIGLDTLGVIEFCSQNYELAEKCHQQAIEIQIAVEDNNGLGYTWTHLGHVYYQLNEFNKAVNAYQTAVQLRQDLKQNSFIDSLAGLMLVKLAQKEVEITLNYFNQITQWLTNQGTDGLEYPLTVYFSCYLVAKTLQPQQAPFFLKTAYNMLNERVTKITHEDVRQKFLTNIPTHLGIMKNWYNFIANQN